MVVLVIGVSLLREVQAGFHLPRYAAFLTQPSPILRHSSAKSGNRQNALHDSLLMGDIA